MTTATTPIDRAHARRRARAELLIEQDVERRLNELGLTEQKCIELAIDPKERVQLKGIIARLRKLPHPFTQCMRDLRKHKPEWSDDRRKRTCQSLKVAAGRAGSTANHSEASVCFLLTDAQATLLEHADLEALAETPEPAEQPDTTPNPGDGDEPIGGD